MSKRGYVRARQCVRGYLVLSMLFTAGDMFVLTKFKMGSCEKVLGSSQQKIICVSCDLTCLACPCSYCLASLGAYQAGACSLSFPVEMQNM